MDTTATLPRSKWRALALRKHASYLRLPRDNDLLVRSYSPVKAGPE